MTFNIMAVYCYAECRYAERHLQILYAMCRYAECRGAPAYYRISALRIRNVL
jgi:hypothetical protein